jgi:hypothetical protein
MDNLDTLLKDLSFIIPNVEVSNINVSELMDFDVHNLQDQFRKDLLYFGFFSMLEVEIAHKVTLEEYAWKDLENDLNESLRVNATEKYTEARLKILVQTNPKWKQKRDMIEQLNYQLSCVRNMVQGLNKKGVALNVLTAKSRAEIGAGISH